LFRRYIELTQSGGVHPDVVANLLYALSLQATDTRKRAANAIAYLESAEDDDGSWHSRGYWGRHYGTYRAVLALTALTPDSPALGRARDYLVSGQHADGGWGPDGRSDPLSTASAALALAALAQPGTGRCLRLALEYLLAAQQPDGSWPGCSFIAFPRVGGPGVHIYRSSTMTTSFCLKAILAGRGAHSTGRVTRPPANPAAMAYRPGLDGPTAADWS
jgi:squalene-hopene/tetraprenyl-beta-curcumene cyclase